MPRPPLSLKAKAVACLAQREHSRTELRRKLLAHVARQARAAAASPLASDAPAVPPGEAEVDALLDALAAQGLLSAERFVETRIHARAARFGNLRIRHELAVTSPEHCFRTNVDCPFLRHQSDERFKCLFKCRRLHVIRIPSETVVAPRGIER